MMGNVYQMLTATPVNAALYGDTVEQIQSTVLLPHQGPLLHHPIMNATPYQTAQLVSHGAVTRTFVLLIPPIVGTENASAMQIVLLAILVVHHLDIAGEIPSIVVTFMNATA